MIFTFFPRPDLQNLACNFHSILSCPRWLPSSLSCNRRSAGFTRGCERTTLGFRFFDFSFGRIFSTLCFSSSSSCCAHIALDGDSDKGVHQVMVWVGLLPSLQSLSLYQGHYIGPGQFHPKSMRISFPGSSPLLPCSVAGMLQKHIQHDHMMGNFHVGLCNNTSVSMT